MEEKKNIRPSELPAEEVIFKPDGVLVTPDGEFRAVEYHPDYVRLQEAIDEGMLVGYSVFYEFGIKKPFDPKKTLDWEFDPKTSPAYQHTVGKDQDWIASFMAGFEKARTGNPMDVIADVEEIRIKRNEPNILGRRPR